MMSDATTLSSISVTVYRHLFDAILEQRLQPGARLTEDTLGQIYGVSRTVVRSALQRLAHEGVVELRRNRGAVVARPDVAEARQVLDARRVVELAVVERLCGRLTAATVERLQELVRLEQDKFARSDSGGSIRVSGEFHLALAEAAGNKPLSQFLRGLISRTSLIISQYELPGRVPCAASEHVGLIDVLAGSDPAVAARAMAEHLAHIETRLRLTPVVAGAGLRQALADPQTGLAGYSSDDGRPMRCSTIIPEPSLHEEPKP